MSKWIRSVGVMCLAMMLSWNAAAEGNPKVKLETSMGEIVLELDQAKAPITVKNFLTYVNDGFYDGTIFHRVINNFMVQGGGMNDKMVQKQTRPSIKNEASNGLKNEVGTIAMARTGNPDSATAQFFINVNNNTFLNKSDPRSDGHGYAVFGKVVAGMDVVDKMKSVKTGSRGMHRDVPVETITINKASVVK